MKNAAFVTEQEQCWILGGEVLDQGMAHPALKVVTAALAELTQALAEAQEQSRGLKRFGVGRTEDPALILARVLPKLRNLGDECAFVADQLEKHLKKG